MPTLRLTPNAPTEIALRYPNGKLTQTRFGRKVLFTLTTGHALFLDLSTAQKIADLAPKPGQRFCICRDKERRGALDHYRVWFPDAPTAAPAPRRGLTHFLPDCPGFKPTGGTDVR